MKIVIQRSLNSSVSVNDSIIAQIKRGMVLLVCLEKNDSLTTVDKAVAKIGKLRIFEDEKRRMNLDITQIKGEFLSISQFTLSWNGTKGNRPSFDNSMEPDRAQEMFDIFCQKLGMYAPVHQGHFGADMSVNILNDGPVTFTLEF